MDNGGNSFSAFDILVGFAAFVLTATVTWIGITLVSLKNLANKQVALLQWLKDEHESDDSKFATVRILPLNSAHQRRHPLIIQAPARPWHGIVCESFWAI